MPDKCQDLLFLFLVDSDVAWWWCACSEAIFFCRKLFHYAKVKHSLDVPPARVLPFQASVCFCSKSEKQSYTFLTSPHVPDSCGYYAHEEFTLGIYKRLGSENDSLASYKIIVCMLLTCIWLQFSYIWLLGAVLCGGSLKYTLTFEDIIFSFTQVAWWCHLEPESLQPSLVWDTRPICPWGSLSWIVTSFSETTNDSEPNYSHTGVKLLLHNCPLWRSTVASRNGRKNWLIKWLVFHLISFSSRASRHLKNFALKKVYHSLACTFVPSFTFSTFSS